MGLLFVRMPSKHEPADVLTGDRLNGAEVMGSDQYMTPHNWASGNTGTPTYCGDPVSGEVYIGRRVEVVCDTPITAQYVAVYHPGGSATLCEVQVLTGLTGGKY